MLIVSLTSYKERFKTLDKVLQSILKQTLKPDLILLNVTQEDFQYIPNSVSSLGIQIHIVPEDLKSHNKYFYTLKEYKNDVVVTIDDDIIYHEDTLKVLWDSYIKFPNCVSSIRTKQMISLPYKLWKVLNNKQYIYSKSLLATGVGGVLYPPNILKIDDSLLPIIRDNITTDDLVLKYVENTLNIKVVAVPNNFKLGIKQLPCSRNGLCIQNTKIFGNNDITIKKLSLI